ncbi:MAG: hypothetical protein WAK90_07485 [Pseudolabrys sp.]
MKALAATMVFLSLTVAAAAKPTPVSSLDQLRDFIQTSVRSDTDVNTGPSGALLERSYFEAPQPQLNVSCRLQLSVFDKTRLTEACN